MMNMNGIKMKKCLFAILLALLGFCAAKAQNKGDYVPDFKQCFKVLTDNRFIYNKYNDSIFIIKDKDEWVSFFKRRAIKNHELFEENKQTINSIKDYFKQEAKKIPSQAYSDLEVCLGDYIYSGLNDPFLTIEFANILEDYNEREAPDSLNSSNLVNIWMALSYVSIFNLGKDTLALSKAYHYFKKNLNEENKAYLAYDRGRAYSLWNLCKTLWITNKLQPIEENRWACRMLQNMIDSIPDLIHVVTPREYMMMKANAQIYDELFVRNVYMVDSTSMDKQQADSLMRKIVKRNLANKKQSINNYQRTLLMQNKLGDISMDAALDSLMIRYRADRKRLKNMKLTDQELLQFLAPCFTLLYINDLSSHSFSRKRKLVKMLCKDVELAYQNRLDNQYHLNYVRNLNQLTTYPRLVKYLKEKERVHFLDALNVATQVTTYAHSVHVAMIAEELMNGVLQYQPELLVGTFGKLQLADILRSSKYYLDFIHQAAMYHDLGKNSIITVVHNDYRPLTDVEFALIKRHPKLGIEYLSIAPRMLGKYRDTTLGHHKWYNGKGGYPEGFDNTKSPMRIMIDIVTLSDCMQAATERVGRNYKGEKNFETVMAEFRRDAGVRYNPDLVSLIDAHPDLAKKLADLINEGWVEIYYNIYSQFIR